jgi:hypothetical protein
VTEGKQKKTSSNAIIFNIARSWSFLFLLSEEEKEIEMCMMVIARKWWS